MADQPQEGDTVMHHGRVHEITELREKPVMEDGQAVVTTIAVWENDRFAVRGFADELVELPTGEADYYLPGRLLARNERAIHEALTGAWPPAGNHLTARQYLDAVDLGEVDRETLHDVIRRRKPEVEEDEVEDYGEALIEQCQTLKQARS